MTIEILGPGCPECDELERRVRHVAERERRDVRVFTITDPAQINAYGARSTPGVAVNGLMRLWGRVPSEEEIRTLLAAA